MWDAPKHNKYVGNSLISIPLLCKSERIQTIARFDFTWCFAISLPSPSLHLKQENFSSCDTYISFFPSLSFYISQPTRCKARITFDGFTLCSNKLFLDYRYMGGKNTEEGQRVYSVTGKKRMMSFIAPKSWKTIPRWMFGGDACGWDTSECLLRASLHPVNVTEVDNIWPPRRAALKQKPLQIYWTSVANWLSKITIVIYYDYP